MNGYSLEDFCQFRDIYGKRGGMEDCKKSDIIGLNTDRLY